MIVALKYNVFFRQACLHYRMRRGPVSLIITGSRQYPSPRLVTTRPSSMSLTSTIPGTAAPVLPSRRLSVAPMMDWTEEFNSP